MGLFGRPARIDEDEDALAEEENQDIPTLPEPPSSTTIAAGTTVTGTLQGEGVIQVEGTEEGEMNLKGAVIIAPSGLVKGPVTADVIRIAGRVEGSVTAREHLHLEKAGSLGGDMTTPSLEVVDGGRLNGRSTMPPHKEN